MKKDSKKSEEIEVERDKFLDNLGARIKAARLSASLTQKELAELLSTNQSWVFMVEDGQQNLQLSSLRKVAQKLNVPIRDLIPDDLEPGPTYEISPEVSETLHRLVSQIATGILRALTKLDKPSAKSNKEPPRAKKSPD